MSFLALGMMIGWLAQLLLSRGQKVNWLEALVAGFGGAFLFGMAASLIAGDGFSLKPSGIIGAFIGALVITGLYNGVYKRRKAKARAAAKARARSGRHLK
jgi:uncharacterized membrane protein YeaQ/YmgE (transglycosylase-associated protein family)